MGTSLSSIAQADSLLMQWGQPVEANRYRGIDESPYYFKEFVPGRVLRSDGRTIDEVMVNYNGYSRLIEARTDAGIFELDPRRNLRVDISDIHFAVLNEDVTGLSLFFQRNADRNLTDRYAAVLFVGDKYRLLKDFEVSITSKRFHNVGKDIVVQRFITRDNYYLRRANELISIRQHRRRIGDAFDHDPRIEEFIRSENLDIKNELDLIRLVVFADSLN